MHVINGIDKSYEGKNSEKKHGPAESMSQKICLLFPKDLQSAITSYGGSIIISV